MKQLIIFLIRKRMGLKKYECFTFDNQKSNSVYWFTNTAIIKRYYSVAKGCTRLKKSSVSLNWLLDDECTITKTGEVVG